MANPTPDPLIWRDPSKHGEGGVRRLVAVAGAAKKLVLVTDLDGTVLDYPDNPAEADWVLDAQTGLMYMSRIRNSVQYALSAKRASEIMPLLHRGAMDHMKAVGFYGLEVGEFTAHHNNSRRPVEGQDFVVHHSGELKRMEASLASLMPSVESVLNTGLGTGLYSVRSIVGRRFISLVNPTQASQMRLDAAIEQLEPYLHSLGAAVKFRWNAWEIQALNNFDKGNAISAILSDEGEATYVYAGDGPNDLKAVKELLRYRERGGRVVLIAVWNAREDKPRGTPAELAQLADITVESPAQLGRLFTATARELQRIDPAMFVTSSGLSH